MSGPGSKQAYLVALDWGTSSLRAYLLGAAGEALAERHLPLGLMNLPRLADGARDFAGAFRTACLDWIEAQPQIPVIACGMVGSAQGWRQAPYVDVPAHVEDLCAGLLAVDTGAGATVRIVPGLKQSQGLPDVIRGEETQVAGALLHHASDAPFLVCLPGTHSKWVFVQDHCVQSFDTFMSGEVYGALQKQTILGQLMEPGPEDAAAFDRGLAVATSEEGDKGLLATLFSVRTLGLTGQIPGTGLADYLSGLLIGYEVQAVRRLYERRLGDLGRIPVLLCGTRELRQRYQHALSGQGWGRIESLSGSSRQGLWHIACGAGLVA